MSVNPYQYQFRRLPQPDDVLYQTRQNAPSPQSAQPPQPVQPTQPVQPAQQARPAQPIQSPQPAQPAKPLKNLPQPDTVLEPTHPQLPYYVAGRDVTARLTQNPDIVEINGTYYYVASRRGDIYVLKDKNGLIEVRIPDEYLKEQAKISNLLNQLLKSGHKNVVDNVGRFYVWDHGILHVYYMTPLGWAEYKGSGELGTGKYQIVGGGEVYRAMGWSNGKAADIWLTENELFKVKKNVENYLDAVNILEINNSPSFQTLPYRFFKENGEWYAFQYDPRTQSYQKVKVSIEELERDLFEQGIGIPLVIKGYNFPDVDKFIEKEAKVFLDYGPEDAYLQYRLKQAFPEFANKDYVGRNNIWDAVLSRLEKYGWSPHTLDDYDKFQRLVDIVYHNPEAWRDIQADLDKQIRDFNRLQAIHEKLSMLEADVLKENVRREEEKKAEEYMNMLYGNREHWFQVLTGQTGSSFLQQISFGLLSGPSQFQQKLYGALGVLGSKANIDDTVFRAGIQVMRGLNPASFFGTDLLGLDLSSAIKASLGLKNLATGKASLSVGEAAYIKAVSQDFTNENLAAYMIGSGLGSGLAMYLQGKMIESVPEAIRFTKWEFTSEEALAGKALKNAGIELKTPEFISNISETLKTKAINVGERIGLVEKVDYVPTRAEVDVAMVKVGGEERAVFKTTLEDFKPAREVLGVEQVPLEYKVSGSDVSLLKLKTGENPVFKPIVGEQTARGFNAGLDAFLKISGKEPRLYPDYSLSLGGTGNWKIFKEIKYIGEEPVLGGPATYRSFDTGLDAFLKVTKGETRLPPDYLLDFEKWVTEAKAPFANEAFYYRVPYEKYVFSSPAEKAEFMKYRGAFAYGAPSENKSIIAVGKPLEKIEPEFIAKTGRYGGEIDYSELIEKLGGYKPQVPKTIDFGDIVSKARKASFEFNYFWKITFPEKVMDVFGDIGDRLKNIIKLGKETKEVPEWTPIKLDSETPTQFALPQGFRLVAGKTGLVEIVEESEPAGKVKPLVEPEMKIPVITKTELTPQVKTAVEFTRFVGPRLPSLYSLAHSFPAGGQKIAPISESMFKPSQELKSPSLDTFIQPRIRTDLFIGQVQAPRLGELTVPRLDVRLEPKIGEISALRIGEITVPKIEPKIEIPPQNIPDYKPPPEETRPRLPGLPPIGSGTRDVPVPGPRLYGRKEWTVDWFGPAVPVPLFPAVKSKTRKSRSGRGGRKK